MSSLKGLGDFLEWMGRRIRQGEDVSPQLCNDAQLIMSGKLLGLPPEVHSVTVLPGAKSVEQGMIDTCGQCFFLVKDANYKGTWRMPTGQSPLESLGAYVLGADQSKMTGQGMTIGASMRAEEIVFTWSGPGANSPQCWHAAVGGWHVELGNDKPSQVVAWRHPELGRRLAVQYLDNRQRTVCWYLEGIEQPLCFDNHLIVDTLADGTALLECSDAIKPHLRTDADVFELAPGAGRYVRGTYNGSQAVFTADSRCYLHREERARGVSIAGCPVHPETDLCGDYGDLWVNTGSGVVQIRGDTKRSWKLGHHTFKFYGFFPVKSGMAVLYSQGERETNTVWLCGYFIKNGTEDRVLEFKEPMCSQQSFLERAKVRAAAGGIIFESVERGMTYLNWYAPDWTAGTVRFRKWPLYCRFNTVTATAQGLMGFHWVAPTFYTLLYKLE